MHLQVWKALLRLLCGLLLLHMLLLMQAKLRPQSMLHTCASCASCASCAPMCGTSFEDLASSHEQQHKQQQQSTQQAKQCLLNMQMHPPRGFLTVLCILQGLPDLHCWSTSYSFLTQQLPDSPAPQLNIASTNIKINHNIAEN